MGACRIDYERYTMNVVNVDDIKKKRRKLPKTVKELQVQVALGTLEMTDVLKALRSKKTSSDVIEILNEVIVSGTIDSDKQNYWEYRQRRELFAKHPNTPASVLASIFHREKFMENPENIDSASSHILSHPAFPVKLLREVLNKIVYDSQFHNTSHTAAYSSYLFRAIENPNIPEEFLRSFAKHRNIVVRAAVAEHLNTPPEVLEYLSTLITPYTRWSSQKLVARNPSAPPHVLKTLSVAPALGIRKGVARNLSTPVDALKAMLNNDRSPTVKYTALYTLFKLGQVEFISNS